MQKSGEGFWGAGAWCIMVGDKQAECHNRVPFYGLRMIIFSRLGALVSPNISYLCSVRGTFFLLKTDKYSEFTSVILWNSVRCKSCSLRVCSTKTRIKTVCSTSGLDCLDRKLSHDIHNIVTDAMRRIFDKAEIHGYSYSRDHKVLRLTIDQEDRLIKREDLEKNLWVHYNS